MKKPMTGYEIKRELDVSTSNFSKSSYGSIYPILKKLVDAKAATYNTIHVGDRLKKEYNITELGEEIFLGWLKSPVENIRSYENILSKVFFLRFLSKEESHRILKNITVAIDNEIKLLKTSQNFVKDKAETYERATFEYGLDYLIFTKKWFETYLDSDNGSRD